MVKYVFILTCGFILGAILIENKHYFTRQIPIAVAELPDAGRYDGKLLNGRFHGRGRIVWPSKAYYEGEFEKGLFHGKGLYHSPTFLYQGDFNLGNAEGDGEIHYANGAKYKGEVKHWVAQGNGVLEAQAELYRGDFDNDQYHGQGELTKTDGSSYSGSFEKGQFHGDGVYTHSNGMRYQGEFNNGEFTGLGTLTSEGRRYEGSFRNWVMHGSGTLTIANGAYTGGFVDGLYEGEGEYIATDGSYYIGQFIAGSYHGKGVFVDSEGDSYDGFFKYGLKHGKGVLTYAEALDGVATIRGEWHHDKLVGTDEVDKQQWVVNEGRLVEHAIYQQQQVLERALTTVVSQDPDKIDLYFVGVAGDGTQGVFRREVNYVESLLSDLYGVGNKSISLVNSPLSYELQPLATVTSIEQTLQAVAQRMDKDNDILFVYLSSHGSRDFELKLSQPGLALQPLTASALGEILKALPVKHKVVVVSACFSGGFVKEIKDSTTLIITSAEAGKSSFGCHDRAKMTYFGEAFFKDSLHQSTTFVDAFYRARDIIRGREAKEGYENSNPLIFKPDAIVTQLNKWRTQLQANQPAVSSYEFETGE